MQRDSAAKLSSRHPHRRSSFMNSPRVDQDADDKTLSDMQLAVLAIENRRRKLKGPLLEKYEQFLT